MKIQLLWLRATLTTIAAMALLAGCTDDGSGADEAAEGDEPCVPNQSVACTCSDGASGARVCEPDGTGYGACSCEGDTSSGDTSSGDTSSGDTSSGDTSSGDTSSGDTSSDSGWDGTSVPSWSNHIVPLFEASCGSGVNGCHSREAYSAAADSDCRGWLSLEDVPLGAEFYAGADLGQPTGCPDIGLHDRLLTLAPWQCAADSRYVTPGSSAQSYVWQKILGQNLCEVSPGVVSKAMPPPDSGITLSEMDKQMIEAWILAGAPNDN